MHRAIATKMANAAAKKAAAGKYYCVVGFDFYPHIHDAPHTAHSHTLSINSLCPILINCNPLLYSKASSSNNLLSNHHINKCSLHIPPFDISK